MLMKSLARQCYKYDIRGFDISMNMCASKAVTASASPGAAGSDGAQVAPPRAQNGWDRAERGAGVAKASEWRSPALTVWVRLGDGELQKGCCECRERGHVQHARAWLLVAFHKQERLVYGGEGSLGYMRPTASGLRHLGHQPPVVAVVGMSIDPADPRLTLLLNDALRAAWGGAVVW